MNDFRNNSELHDQPSIKWHCVECKKDMDDERLKWHDFFHSNSHTIKSLTTNDEHQLVKCSIHQDQVLSRYCEYCDECLCSICMNSHPKAHKIEKLNEKVDKLRDKILLDLQNKHLAIKINENLKQKKLNSLSEHCGNIKDSIKVSFVNLRSQLELQVNIREQLLLGMCNEQYENLRKELQESIQNEEQPNKAEIKELISKIKSANSIEIVRKNSELSQDIAKINSKEMLQFSDVSNNITYHETIFDYGAIQSFGVLNETNEQNTTQPRVII